MKITLDRLQEFIQLSRDDELVGVDLISLMDRINEEIDNNKPEPITEKDFLDLLYQTTNTPRILGEEGHAMAIFRPLLKAINEHFLGGK